MMNRVFQKKYRIYCTNVTRIMELTDVLKGQDEDVGTTILTFKTVKNNRKYKDFT